MENKNTYFILDGAKLTISPNLLAVISFLGEIDKEVKTFLGVQKKLETVMKQYVETWKFVKVLSDKLKENSIDFKFHFSEDPTNAIDKLKISRPIRSEMIVLFASLETLFCLNLAYENKISDRGQIIKMGRNENNINNFLKVFCLKAENEWGLKNPDRLKRISAYNFRHLRNCLTHFFSVGAGLAISYPHPFLDSKARRLENAINFSANFLSPEDLLEILEGAYKLMIKKWSEDYKNCIENKSNEFDEKISSVKALIEKSGAIMVNNDQINI